MGYYETTRFWRQFEHRAYSRKGKVYVDMDGEHLWNGDGPDITVQEPRHTHGHEPRKEHVPRSSYRPTGIMILWEKK